MEILIFFLIFKLISKTYTANLLGARYTKQTEVLVVIGMTITVCKSNMQGFRVVNHQGKELRAFSDNV